MEKKKNNLKSIWKKRLKIRAEGYKMWAEGYKMWAEGNKMRAEGDKMWAEGNKMWAEGDKMFGEGYKMRAEGDEMWAEAIIEVYGNIKMEWKNWDEKKEDYECHLKTGEIFRP